MATINHAKTVTIADPTQAELNAQIALGNYPPGTLLADIALASDHNAAHTVSMSTNKLLGRATAGTGAMEEITLGTNLSFTGTILNAASGAGVSWTEIEVDFGSTTPQYDSLFTITDAAVTATSKIQILESGKPATGRVAGDAQWDSIFASALPGTGNFQLYAMAHPGPVLGKRKLQYTVN